MTTTINEREYLSAAETAKLLRKHLKREFPGVDFRVNSKTYSGGASIRVYWTNGPTREQVDAIAQGYEGGGFDGMIDMAYGYDNYLLPDGTLMVAGTSGTEGSRGSVPGFTVEAPPGAKRVRNCNDFVFTGRNYDQATFDAEMATVKTEYGLPADANIDGFDERFAYGARSIRQEAHRRLHDRELPASKYLGWNNGGTM